MSLSRPQAISEMVAQFLSVWDAVAIPVKWPNKKDGSLPPSDASSPWCRFDIQHTGSRKTTIGGAGGLDRYESFGILTIQLFTEIGVGITKPIGEVDPPSLAASAFEGKSTPGGVYFRDVSIIEVGENGTRFQHNITASFDYEEFK